MELKELLLSITGKLAVIEDLINAEKNDLVEVEIAVLFKAVIFDLIIEINHNKELLDSFLDFVEEQAFKETNPYELTKLNELLELKPIINDFGLENIAEEINDIALILSS